MSGQLSGGWQIENLTGNNQEDREQEAVRAAEPEAALVRGGGKTW